MKSSQEQRKAIDELYQSGSISKQEYDEMIKILKGQEQDAPDQTDQPSFNSSKILLYSLLGVLLILLVYGINKYLESQKELQFNQKERELILQIVQLESECRIMFNNSIINEIENINNDINLGKFSYRSLAREEFKKVIENNFESSMNSNSDSCRAKIEEMKSRLFSRYKIGTPKYNDLSDLYNKNLEEQQSLTTFQNSIQHIENAKNEFESLLEEKIPFEDLADKSFITSNTVTALSLFFEYYNAILGGAENTGAIYNTVNLPLLNFKGNSNVDGEQLQSIIRNESVYNSNNYSLDKSSIKFVRKENELYVWQFVLNQEYIGENSSIDATVKIFKSKISYFAFE